MAAVYCKDWTADGFADLSAQTSGASCRRRVVVLSIVASASARGASARATKSFVDWGNAFRAMRAFNELCSSRRRGRGDDDEATRRVRAYACICLVLFIETISSIVDIVVVDVVVVDVVMSSKACRPFETSRVGRHGGGVTF